ncbi:NUDIX hydrolase [Marivita sp. GX14005]|uniref:NUDIX domain-containing protein n=1 Tax=Marivita sp. GX14005 TaxID=2942276 RepID=UPI002018CF21|nr:NUDIX hydrolase [Marivita sp. GX14005]MCL3881620.1 NUDIX hydrolase [Marivita sp. GX14005]
MRRFDDPPERGRRYRFRMGAYAILPGPRGVLITRQDGQEREYQLPGGGIDPGESPVQALAREVREETGWTIAEPRRLGAYRRFTFMPEYDIWAEKLCLIYMARPILRRGPPSEPDHTALWLPQRDALRWLSNSGDRDFLRRHGSQAAIFQKRG